MLTKQNSAPEACNLINKEIGVNANFNAEEGHCVGVLIFFFIICFSFYTVFIPTRNSLSVSVLHICA